MEKIAIVGGGLLGLGIAWKLTNNENYEITLIEKENNLGGMSSYMDIGPVQWDKFYHVILSGDENTLGLISELGLESQLFWKEARSGFFGQGKLVSMSTVVDFLRFPFLNLWDKFRLGLGIIYISRLNHSTRLENIYVKNWMSKVFGPRVYERIWEPLLRSKLGSCTERTSASFIWATIKRLYGARQDSSHKTERMGHITGGFRVLIECWEDALSTKGVIIRKGEEVLTIDPVAGRLETDKEIHKFDKLILTIPSEIIADLLPLLPDENPYWALLREQEYMGVICAVFLIKKSLSPYYVINLLDGDLPFTGIIESSNIIGTDNLDGYHLVYLPYYYPREDRDGRGSDEDIMFEFILGLKKVFPSFSEEDIIEKHLIKESYVQPLYVLNYGNRIPPFESPLGNLWIANTSMITNSTLNNDATLELAERLSKEISGL